MAWGVWRSGAWWRRRNLWSLWERRARPDWGRDMDIPFARAIDRGGVIKIRELNSGFSSSQTINFAYYQASLVVEYIRHNPMERAGDSPGSAAARGT